MINAKFFVALFLFLFICLGSLRYMPHVTDIFSAEDSERLRRLSYLPVEFIAREKFGHWRHSDVEVGIFGNSHTWEIRASHLGLPAIGFFNYSVPDSSIRQTIRTLEVFRDQNRLPGLIIVGVDNFEKTLVRNPMWPAPPLRWAAALQELAVGIWRETIPLDEVVWLGLRHGKFELEELKHLFNARRVYEGLSFRFPQWLPPLTEERTAYRVDGSYATMPATETTTELLISTNKLLAGYFRFDLERLATIVAGKSRTILFEIPIEPSSALHYARNPSPQAETIRRIFRASCLKLRLECYEAPVLKITMGGEWRDAHHPSPSVLGIHLQDVINRKIDQMK